MLASVDTLVNGPFTDLLNLSKRLQGFSLKNGSVDVSALMDMPDIVKQAHKDISQQLTKLNKVPTPSVAKVATVLETEKAALKTVDRCSANTMASLTCYRNCLARTASARIW